MPNSVWQFEVLRPSASERWWERNDSDCMKNSENADTPMSAIVYTPSPFRLSGKAAQASLRPLKSRSRISTLTLNQKTDSVKIKKSPKPRPFRTADDRPAVLILALIMAAGAGWGEKRGF